MLTADVASYAGRTVDLLLYDGMTAAGDTQLTPSLILPGQNGALIAGVQKLAQRFLLELLTEVGSLQHLPLRGCTFLRDARMGGWRTPEEVRASFYMSLLDIERNLIDEEEVLTDPPDERYKDAEINSVSIAVDTVFLNITVTSQAGTSREVLYPLRVPKG